MAIPTFLIGLLPTYAAIGIAAPIALTLLRMVQGLSVGGEYTSSMVFLVEHAPHGRRGLMGAYLVAGVRRHSARLGDWRGIAASMSTAALDAWGWRIPFLLGLVVGIAGYFLRRHVVETVPAERRERPPIIETLHDHRRLVLGLAGLSVFNAVGFYVSFVYLVSWLQTADGIPPARALEINSISMLTLLPVMVVTGLWNDRRAQAVSPARLRSRLHLAVPLFWPCISTGAVCPARTTGAGPDHRHLLRHAAHHHGGGGAAAGALHGRGARLQHLPGRDRRGHAAGGDLAGRAHGERARARVPDHGGPRW